MTCGPSGLLGCEPEIVRVLVGIINVYCPSGLTTCADPTINVVIDIVMDLVCPSGSLGYCAGELGRQVGEQLAFLVDIAQGLALEACGGGVPDACLQKVLDMLNTTALPIVCQANELFWCVDNTMRAIDNLVASACSLGSTTTGRDGLTECVYRVLSTVELVLDTVDDAMIARCGSTDVNTCLSNLLDKLNVQITDTCGLLPGTAYSDGANRCVEKLLDVVNALLAAAKAQMEQTCGSRDGLVCANKIVGDVMVQVETIHDTVANICKGHTSTSSTSDSAATNCANKALETVEVARQLVVQSANGGVITACGSSDANICLRNLLDELNVQTTDTCGLLPGTAYSDGANRCVEKFLDVANALLAAAEAQMVQVCGSSDALICANNIVGDVMIQLETIHDTIANICKGHLSTSSTTESAVTNCVNKVLETVDLARRLAIQNANGVMVTACGSSDVTICLGNLLEKLNLQITDTCGVLPGTAYSDGTNRCVEKVLDIVNALLAAAKAQMVQVCGSSDALPCANRILGDVMAQLETIHDTVANVCKGHPSTSSTTDSAVTNCISKVLATVAVVQALFSDAVTDLCGSNDVEMCREKYMALIEGLMNSVCPSTTTSGAEACVEEVNGLVAAAINDLYVAVCGSDDLAACRETFESMIHTLVNRVCSSSAGGSGAQACIEMATEIATQAVDDLYFGVCGPSDLTGCQEKYNELVQTLLRSFCSGSGTSGTQACIDMLRAIAQNAVHAWS